MKDLRNKHVKVCSKFDFYLVNIEALYWNALGFASIVLRQDAQWDVLMELLEVLWIDKFDSLHSFFRDDR